VLGLVPFDSGIYGDFRAVRTAFLTFYRNEIQIELEGSPEFYRIGR
jgi:hypothetical protein